MLSSCTSCDSRLLIPAEQLGQTIRCQFCGENYIANETRLTEEAPQFGGPLSDEPDGPARRAASNRTFGLVLMAFGLIGLGGVLSWYRSEQSSPHLPEDADITELVIEVRTPAAFLVCIPPESIAQVMEQFRTIHTTTAATDGLVAVGIPIGLPKAELQARCHDATEFRLEFTIGETQLHYHSRDRTQIFASGSAPQLREILARK